MNMEETSDGSSFHYYYNREERLKRAPKIVQDYYNGNGPKPVKGLFAPLVATKQNRLIFFSLIIFCTFIFIYGFLSNRSSSQLFGSRASLSAFTYGSDLYVSFKIDSSNKPCEKAFTITFKCYESQGGEVQDTYVEEAYYNGEELFIRTKFPCYDIIKVTSELSYDQETKSFSCYVTHH